MKLKSVLSLTICAAMCCASLALFGCAGESSSSSSSSAVSENTSRMSSQIPEATASFSDDELMAGTHHATIEVEGYAPVTVELDADSAPISVTNFVNLANEGYYDGKTFYRVVEDFCLQGGTNGNTASGSDSSLETITGEFADNGVDNPLADHFEKGTVAMARTSLPNSATSTFFITLGDNDMVGASLDGQYAAFGKISEQDMKVIDQIVADSIAAVDDPYMGSISDEAAQPKIVSIKVID